MHELQSTEGLAMTSKAFNDRRIAQQREMEIFSRLPAAIREAMNNCQQQPPRASTVLNALLRGVSEETIIRTINGEKQ